MRSQVSIAEAKAHLARIVHDVERGGAVTLTRRGSAVAVLISKEEYDRTHATRLSFDAVVDETLLAFAGRGVSRAEFPAPRDKSAGTAGPW